MAISAVDAFGLLDEFRAHNLINTWWFNQVDGNSVPEYGCLGYAQQARDLYGRELRSAFNRIKEALNYAPRPVFETERIPVRIGALRITEYLYHTRYGHVQAFGTRATTELEKGASVVYSKSDASLPDNDTATITVTHASLDGMDSDEVRVFFQTSDGAPSDAEARYEIRPVSVSISGTTATITAHRALFVKPAIWDQPYTLPGAEEVSVNYADSSDAGDFVTAVDVFRVYPDSTDAVQLIDARGNASTLTPTLIDADMGEFTVQYGSTVNLAYAPVAIDVSYYAGKAKSNGVYDPDLNKAVCHLANCHILTSTHGPCLAENVIWMTDNSFFEDEEADATPFGRKHGQKEAWRLIEAFKEYQGGFIS